MKFYATFLLAVIVNVTVIMPVFGQKQLVVLKGQKVLLRLYPGDDIVFKLKGDKKVQRSYVNNIFDTAVVAHKQVIPFYKIDRLYFQRGNLLNVFGGLLVGGGAGFFLIDQLNNVAVQHNDLDFEKSVAIPSAIMVGTGLPLMLMKKKSTKLGGKYRVIMAEKGSPFYRADLRQDVSGF
jgi:hypothetical protein